LSARKHIATHFYKVKFEKKSVTPSAMLLQNRKAFLLSTQKKLKKMKSV